MRTLSFNGITNNIYNFCNNKLLSKMFTNPLYLSIIIVCILIIITYKMDISDYKDVFKMSIFSIIITLLILCYHDKLKKQEYVKEGGNELTNYFSNIAENSNSNISNIQNTNKLYNKFNNDSTLDNIDVNTFFNF